MRVKLILELFLRAEFIRLLDEMVDTIVIHRFIPLHAFNQVKEIREDEIKSPTIGANCSMNGKRSGLLSREIKKQFS